LTTRPRYNETGVPVVRGQRGRAGSGLGVWKIVIGDQLKN
jgi:hypothetical protein